MTVEQVPAPTEPTQGAARTNNNVRVAIAYIAFGARVAICECEVTNKLNKHLRISNQSLIGMIRNSTISRGQDVGTWDSAPAIGIVPVQSDYSHDVPANGKIKLSVIIPDPLHRIAFSSARPSSAEKCNIKTSYQLESLEVDSNKSMIIHVEEVGYVVLMDLEAIAKELSQRTDRSPREVPR